MKKKKDSPRERIEALRPKLRYYQLFIRLYARRCKEIASEMREIQRQTQTSKKEG